MNSKLKIMASGPGEAAIILEDMADRKDQKFSIAFPQFSSIPIQKVLRQEIQGKDLALIIDADRLADILEVGSPCQIKIPELELIQTVIWPAIVGKRSHSRNVIDVKTEAVAAPGSLGSEPVIDEVEVPEEKDEAIHKKDKAQSDDRLVKSTMNTEGLTNASPDLDRDFNPLDKSENLNESDDYKLKEIARPKKKISSFLLFIGIGLAILLLGGAFAYFQKNHHAVEKTPQTIEKKKDAEKKQQFNKEIGKKVEKDKKESAKLPNNSSSAITPNVVLNLEHLPVNDVLNKAPNTATITKEGERRLNNKQADDGILLLESAASKGDSEAMLKLGLLYSPVDFKTNGPIPSPDMREAARYFQKAVENGSKEAEAPRLALHDWLSKKAESGDEMARLTLKDFWK